MIRSYRMIHEDPESDQCDFFLFFWATGMQVNAIDSHAVKEKDRNTKEIDTK